MTGQSRRSGAYWFRLAAEQGLAEAQYNLGVSYQNGSGVQKDDVEALKWYTIAAYQGHPNAQSNLGVCYFKGEGVPKDILQGTKWLLSAALQGEPTAQYNLGLYYHYGLYNYSQAADLYRSAVEQGKIDSLYHLGNLYAEGKGVKKDINNAKHLWTLAIQNNPEIYILALEQDNLTALYHFGTLYAEGKGVDQNMDQAAHLWALAAERGHIAAKDDLAVLNQPQNAFGKWNPPQKDI